jgi:tRNA threonylcarbamoyladenosine biosynthesis protein TsaB
MLVMGVDISSEIGALGLVDETGLLGEANLRLIHRHSERLLPNIDSLLKETGYSLSELDGLSVTLGPGSFTGLRIGLSTIKTLVQVLKIPVIGLSTLDVLAFNLPLVKGWLVPVIDAKRERVYTSLYQYWQEDIRGVKRWQDRVLTVNELLEQLALIDREGAFFLVGDGVAAYSSLFLKSKLDLHLAPALFNYTRGGIVARLGSYYLEKGVKDDYLNLLPNYLKKPQAEINWQRNRKGYDDD